MDRERWAALGPLSTALESACRAELNSLRSAPPSRESRGTGDAYLLGQYASHLDYSAQLSAVFRGYVRRVDAERLHIVRFDFRAEVHGERSANGQVRESERSKP